MCLQIGDAIVCGVRNVKWCFCGRMASALCDWKVAAHRSGTCDRPLCETHGHKVAHNKHLCAEHLTAFECWKRRHNVVDLAKYRRRIAGQQELFFGDPDRKEA